VANYDTPYDPNMRGVLFKNDQKGNAKAPQYRGSAVIDNVDLNISAWIKESKKSGDKFMSLKFEAKRPPNPRPSSAELAPKPLDNWDDDAPF
jgi:uncharacterized protein (DUF736 family)